MPEEHFSEPAENQASNLDDVFVPGLGVRAALGGDDEHEPRLPPLWFLFREACIHSLAAVSQSTVRAARVARTTCLRVVPNLKSARNYADAWRPKVQAQLAHSSQRGFQTARTALRQAGDGLGSGGRRAVSTLRSASRGTLALAKPLARRSTRALQGAGSRMLSVARVTCHQIRADFKRPLSLPRVPAALVRRTHRAQSFLDRSAHQVKGRLHASRFFRARFQTLRRYQPTVPDLRRAAPALAVLLAMVIFVIQQIARAVSR